MTSDRSLQNHDATPLVRVGIAEIPHADIIFNGEYRMDSKVFSGAATFDASYLPEGDSIFSPCSPKATFTVRDVTIGKDFHWQRSLDQTFRGSLLLRRRGSMLTVINILPVEWYLESVISSEMNADAPSEFLKAHAVISRSWLMAQIKGACSQGYGEEGMTDTPETRVKWYDHSGHTGFDVCADDHCQRYQGITGINESAREAVIATRGEILTFGDEICDARFSKCCGGAFETFENCWQPVPKGYLRPGPDTLTSAQLPDLSVEENARTWIMSRPEAFCAAPSGDILRKVLKDYDRSTSDFYRWKVEYAGSELSDIIRRRSGVDFGEIIDLQPVARGASGRIILLRVIGTRHTMTIGKELEIRRTLSRSHLYSSAFVVERSGLDSRGIPEHFILHGAGWGHGVGLCQIGAAVMASQGHTYRRILSHYYPDTRITTLNPNP